MKLTIGAYAAYPPINGDDTQAIRELLGLLAADPRVCGFEIPFNGYNQPAYWNGAWPKGVPVTDSVVITSVPGMVRAEAQYPKLGLASTSESGRQLAIEFARGLNARARMLVANGYRAIAAVVPSGPHDGGSQAQFVKSLEEICSWDWYGVRVVVEHCDAHNGKVRPQKAYLPLAEELAAIHRLYHDMGIKAAASAERVRLGMVINWGRSVLETGTPEGVLEHLERCHDAGYLRGFMLSGISAEETSFGPAWEDAQLLPAHIGVMGNKSLLTRERIAQAWTAAGDDLLFKGVTMGIRPQDLSVTARAQQLRQVFDLIAGA